MNRWQKIAWFNLVISVVAFLVCGLLAATMPREDILVPPNRLTVVIIVSLLLVGVSGKIFRKKREGVDSDERDKLIERKAKKAGWMAFAWSMFVTFMIIFVIVGPKGHFSPYLIPIIGIIGMGFIAESVATLIQYGFAGEGENL